MVRSEPGAGATFVLWLPTGAGAAARAEGAAAAAAGRGLAGAGALGRMLLSGAERLERELVERLVADPQQTAAAGTDPATLADLTALLLAALGRSLVALDPDGDPDLLEDAEDVQALLSERHGRQRRRLGWTRPDLEREFRLLREIVDAYLRREAARHTVVDVTGAMAALHRLLDRAQTRSLAALESTRR